MSQFTATNCVTVKQYTLGECIKFHVHNTRKTKHCHIRHDIKMNVHANRTKIRTSQCCHCSIKPVTLETYGRQTSPFIGAACKTNWCICTDQLGRRHKYDQPPHTACAAISSTLLINSYINKVICKYMRMKDTKVTFKSGHAVTKANPHRCSQTQTS
jgi:hypothetical protein